MIFYEFHMDSIGIPYCFPSNSIWTPLGLHMDCLLKLYGFQMIPYGLSTNCTGIPWGVHWDFLLIPYGFHRDSTGIPYELSTHCTTDLDWLRIP